MTCMRETAFRQQCRSERDLLHDQIRPVDAADPRRVILCFGTETEEVLTRGTAPATVAEAVLARARASGTRGLTTELHTSIVESVTGPFPEGLGDLEALYAARLAQRRALTAAARVEGAQLLSLGLHPALSADYLRQGAHDYVPKGSPRYELLWRLLWNLPRPPSFEVPTSATALDVPSSPVPGAMTTGLHVNFQPRRCDFGRAANLTYALSWVFARLSSTSPFALNQIGAWCSRLYYVMRGFDPSGCLVPFGHGVYLQHENHLALIEWLETLDRTRPFFLDVEQAGLPAGTQFPATRVASALGWQASQRLRLAMTDAGPTPYIEFRVPDAALTLADEIVDVAVFLGVMSSYLRDGTRAQDLLPYEAAERTFMAIAHTGACRLPWRGCEQDSAAVIADEILPRARCGLRAEGVEEALVELIIDVARLRALPSMSDRSGRSWLQRQVLDAGRAGGIEVERLSALIEDLATRQAYQPDSLEVALREFSVVRW